MRQFDTMLPLSEVRDLADEVRRLFDDLDRGRDRSLTPTGIVTPGLDVVETDEGIEILLDVPGIGASQIRILIKGGVVVIVGEKTPPDPSERADATFHLVERGFGRFARAVRLNGAYHSGRARATLREGELRIRVPRIEERRGGEIAVTVEDESGAVNDAG